MTRQKNIPAAPPVYRPQPVPRVLQAKARPAQAPQPQSSHKPQPRKPQAPVKTLQPKTPQHVTVARRGPTVPVTPGPKIAAPVLQRKPFSSPPPAPTSRPGPVVQRSRPHLPPAGTRIAFKPASAPVGLLNTRSIQRAEDDRYAKQNFMAMKAMLSVGKVVQDDGQTLLTMREEDFDDPRVQKKFEKNTKITVVEVCSVHLAEQDFLRLIDKKEPGFRQRFAPIFAHVKKNMTIEWLWPTLCQALGNRGLHIREAHANSRNLLPHVVDIPTVMNGCTSIVKWAWYGYAIQQTYKADVPVQWAEIMSGGITSRIIYDWWNDIFYMTPHYSDWEDTKAKLPSRQDVNLDFANPYVKLVGTSDWRARSDRRQLQAYRDEISHLRKAEALMGIDQRAGLLKASMRYNKFASLLGEPLLSEYDIFSNPDRGFTRQDVSKVKPANRKFIPR